jgi:hypothetical protein
LAEGGLSPIFLVNLLGISISWLTTYLLYLVFKSMIWVLDVDVIITDDPNSCMGKTKKYFYKLIFFLKSLLA